MVFGRDYSTPDGTCIRDYVHVEDLIDAHARCLSAIDVENRIYNLGNGRGFSVLEVIEAARKITGRCIPVEFGPRRPGDPAVLVAASDKIRRELDWRPHFTAIEPIVASAWDWYQRHPNGYAAKCDTEA